jgi:hypothetical protein
VTGWVRGQHPNGSNFDRGPAGPVDFRGVRFDGVMRAVRFDGVERAVGVEFQGQKSQRCICIYIYICIHYAYIYIYT